MITYKIYSNSSHYCDECGAKDSSVRIMCISGGAFLCADCLKKFNQHMRMGFLANWPHGSKYVVERPTFEMYLNVGSVTRSSFDPKNITAQLFNHMDAEMEDLKLLMSQRKIIIKSLRAFIKDYDAFKKALIEFMSQ